MLLHACIMQFPQPWGNPRDVQHLKSEGGCVLDMEGLIILFMLQLHGMPLVCTTIAILCGLSPVTTFCT